MSIPAAPGTTEIPPNHVRVFHYTGAPADQIRQQGLMMQHARGEHYDEPNLIWGSGNFPQNSYYSGNNVVEFSVPHDDPRWDIGKMTPGVKYDPEAEDQLEAYKQHVDKGGSHFTFRGDIRPEEIISVHEPWHDHYRYMVENQLEPDDYQWLKEDDNLPQERRALEEYERTHGQWPRHSMWAIAIEGEEEPAQPFVGETWRDLDGNELKIIDLALFDEHGQYQMNPQTLVEDAHGQQFRIPQSDLISQYTPVFDSWGKKWEAIPEDQAEWNEAFQNMPVAFDSGLFEYARQLQEQGYSREVAISSVTFALNGDEETAKRIVEEIYGKEFRKDPEPTGELWPDTIPEHWSAWKLAEQALPRFEEIGDHPEVWNAKSGDVIEFTGTLYHGTNPPNVEPIAEQGFELDFPKNTDDKIWLVSDPDFAKWYGDAMPVNVHLPEALVLDEGDRWFERRAANIVRYPGRDRTGSRPYFIATTNDPSALAPMYPQTVRASWKYAVNAIPAQYTEQDPLDLQGKQPIFQNMQSEWWTLPEDQQKQAIINAFRATMLSPRLKLRDNAIMYQEFMSIPAEESDPDVFEAHARALKERWDRQGQGDLLGEVEPMGWEKQVPGKLTPGFWTNVRRIAALGPYADTLRKAAIDDLQTNGGKGTEFRKTVMTMGIPGVGPKVASFAWLALNPTGSDLGTLDVWMMRHLNQDVESPNNPNHYFELEDQLRDEKDALYGPDTPLGQYQWGVWDKIRTPGLHQDHSPLRVHEPTPYHEVAWGDFKRAPRPQRLPDQAPGQEALFARTAHVHYADNIEHYKDEWQPGENAFFEYHCFESEKSCDAEMWHHTHQPVTVLEKREPGTGATLVERGENGGPAVYRVRFEDGYEYDAFEDELMTDPSGYYRPDYEAR